jgi:AraC family transcriptional regulator
VAGVLSALPIQLWPTHIDCVVMHQSSADRGNIRTVGGQLVSAFVADTTSTRVEILRRRSAGTVFWEFRQPKLALFWFRKGIEHLRLTVDGHPADSSPSRRADLCLVPPSVKIDGEFEINEFCDYTVVFIEPALAAAQLGHGLDRPLVNFAHDELRRSLAGLCREAIAGDSVYQLYAEGWAMQALAHIARAAGSSSKQRQPARGGLAGRTLRQVEDYLHAHFANPLTIKELSKLAGLSPRHFLRAFHDSIGQTPLRYVMTLKIEEAKRLLSQSSLSLTEIAIACGFCHSQHFTTSFKRVTGLTPSAFRRMCLS